ncbi:stalk domain-containing protein [Aminipila butyrica]
MKDNRTYASVRYLAEAYGYKVTWDQATNTVVLNSETE